MRKTIVVGMMAVAIASAGEKADAKKTVHDVDIYLQNNHLADPVFFARARAVTTRIFAGIGVRLRWKVAKPPAGHGCESRLGAGIVVGLAAGKPEDFHPGAAAYSFPYAPHTAPRVVVLYDRVLRSVRDDLQQGAVAMGHILAHEITHVLQGIARHSDEGVMKAQWSREDRERMRRGSLPFAAADVKLIHRSLAKRKCGAREANRRKESTE
jgi:hypothetical protein